MLPERAHRAAAAGLRPDRARLRDDERRRRNVAVIVGTGKRRRCRASRTRHVRQAQPAACPHAGRRLLIQGRRVIVRGEEHPQGRVMGVFGARLNAMTHRTARSSPSASINARIIARFVDGIVYNQAARGQE